MTVIDYSDPLGTIEVTIDWDDDIIDVIPTGVSYTVAVLNANEDNDLQTQIVESLDDPVTFKVEPGKWDIIVLAYESDCEDPIAIGTAESVTVKAGENRDVEITMELLIDDIDNGDPSGTITVGISWSIGTDPPLNVSYTVTVTNTEGDDGYSENVASFNLPVTFEVEPGYWTVEVEASVGGVPRAYGANSLVKVEAGKSTSASVVIREVTKVVRTWQNLKDIFEKNSGENEVVVIINDLDADTSMNIADAEWNITLLAEQDVTIKKSKAIQNSLFRVLSGCKLTLGGTGGGTITIDGNDYGDSSLIVVQADGELIMNDGVTLKNNIVTTTQVRGGGVTVDGGIFTMKGGTISGNSTVHNGGGVYVDTGTFIKEGGTIYGDTVGNSDSNKADRQGDAVYDKATSYAKDTTSGPTDMIQIPAAAGIIVPSVP
jgi:hypothetical protein